MKHVLSFFGLALISFAVLALMALPLKGGDNNPQTPLIHAVTPEPASPGATVTAEGADLGKSLVSELYVTQNNNDVKLEIVTQASDKIVAKLPKDLAPGRYRLMVLTVGARPQYIEQPVQLTVQ